MGEFRSVIAAWLFWEIACRLNKKLGFPSDTISLLKLLLGIQQLSHYAGNFCHNLTWQGYVLV